MSDTMKKQLLENLKKEYIELNANITKASFALSTVDMEQEDFELLQKQVGAMVQYSQFIEQRAAVIAKRRNR